MPEPDLIAIRKAIAAGDADGFLSSLAGRDIDDVLQQVGPGVIMALEHRVERAEPLAVSVINRLTMRCAEGDQELANDLLAWLRHEPIPGQVIPVDLEMLGDLLEGDAKWTTGAYVDLHTGEVYNESDADSGMVGEDAAIDVESDPDRWLWLDLSGSQAGWGDMAAFTARQYDTTLREQLERAIEGKGAFRRFRDLVHEVGLADQWRMFSDDRRIGRTRARLAEHGVRVG